MIQVKSLIKIPLRDDSEGKKLIENELYEQFDPVSKKGKRKNGLTKRFFISEKKGLEDTYYPAVDEQGNVSTVRSPRVYKMIENNPMQVYQDVYVDSKVRLNRKSLDALHKKLKAIGRGDLVELTLKQRNTHYKKGLMKLEPKLKEKEERMQHLRSL